MHARALSVIASEATPFVERLRLAMGA